MSVHELGTLVSPDLSLKASGQDLLESRPSLLPLTPDVLRTIAGEVENGRIRDHFGLLRAARQHQISFQRLKRLLHPSRGLTGIGRQFLDTSWTPKRIALALNAVQRSTPRAPDQGVSSPGAIVAPRKPVTADLLLEICRNGPAWLASHGGLRHFADFHHFSFTTLKKCVFASTATLTPKGIRKVQKAYPDFTIDEKAATLRAPGRRHKIPSE